MVRRWVIHVQEKIDVHRLKNGRQAFSTKFDEPYEEGRFAFQTSTPSMPK